MNLLPNSSLLFCKELRTQGVEFLKSADCCDCSFFVGTAQEQETISSYKVILAMSSPVFEAMFYGSMAGKAQDIPITDMHPEDFKMLLSYIYTNRVNIISFKQASALLYGSRKYMLENLQKICSDYMAENLDATNACAAYELGKLFDDTEILEKATEIITNATQLVINRQSFENIHLSTMIYIFSLPKLCIDSEIDLFNAASRFAKAKYKDKSQINKKSEMRDAIKHIRFLTLNAKEFADIPGITDLLTEAEALAVLANLASQNTDVAYPREFSSNHETRLNNIKSKSLQFTFKNIKNFKIDVFVNSPPYYISNLEWKITVRPSLQEHERGKRKYLGIYLSCTSLNESSLNCICDSKLKIISNKPGVEDFCENDMTVDTYTKDEYSWGYRNFLEWGDLLNPNKGYTKDEAVTIGTDITIKNVFKTLQ